MTPLYRASRRQHDRTIVLTIVDSSVASWRHGETIVLIFTGRGAPVFLYRAICALGMNASGPASFERASNLWSKIVAECTDIHDGRHRDGQDERSGCRGSVNVRDSATSASLMAMPTKRRVTLASPCRRTAPLAGDGPNHLISPLPPRPLAACLWTFHW
jgi:hypothetical protein